ncbi:GNAT family N-acetyltransferase [Kineosporia sp. J2-2]|uniref:GNAT family N-acetyltransferase n=1 Tax=Kineosporia corallincola TaxID=2835133 RepID=A0ABS5TLK8_9ACTN|nr:GNAT family N-acetyltransferase [Kineosporia corallincola]MBT0771993.1 GNAT family N-acetyltransferase [Kineosporia corallincola]
MTQATLSTRRLTLLPLAPRHLEHEVALDTDPQVMRYLFSGRPRLRDDIVAAHHRRLRVAKEHPGLGFWVGLLDGTFTGWWLLEPAFDDGRVRPGEAEIGYRLLPGFWRRGLASEGAAELLRHAFTDLFPGLGTQRVFGQTMAVNQGSRATMASIGLRHVRSFHEEWDEPIPGAEHGEVEYAITREEWLAGPAGQGRGPT